MAVRNIHSLTNIKPIPVYHWIPPKYHPLYKIEIERSDGTIDEITNIIYNGKIKDSINENIGSFNFIIDNSTEQYTDVWKGNDILRFYCDYATIATTLRFRGRIEKVSAIDNTIKIIGRSDSLDLLNILVTYAAEDTETSSILTTLFSSFATQFTTSNINSSSVNVSVSWYQKPMLECIVELCNKAGFDFYIDSNLDAHYFESGSIKNNTEVFVHDANIERIDDFGRDYSIIKNKITVQGTDLIGLPVLWTEKSNDPEFGINSSLGVRHKVVIEEGINSILQAQSRAEAELAIGIDSNYEGQAEVFPGLATIQPGEQVRGSAPKSNIQPNYYTIKSYEHDFSNFIKTTLYINKIPLNLQKVINKTRQWGALEGASKPSSYSESSSNMEFSWNINFNSDSGSHTNTLITGGFLKTDGSSSGEWESNSYEIDSNVTAAVLRVTGEVLATLKVFVSFDGGAVYRQIYGQGVPAVQTIPSGSNLKLKLFLNSADTEVEGIALLYK